MSLEVHKFTRKSFPVEAVRVTAENMEDVATWCDGTIQSEDNERGRDQKFIKVRVQNPLTDRQTKAFVGDWVLYAGKGYKCYRDKPFRESFDKLKQNVFEKNTSSPVGTGGSTGRNPGGTH